MANNWRTKKVRTLRAFLKLCWRDLFVTIAGEQNGFTERQKCMYLWFNGRVCCDCGRKWEVNFPLEFDHNHERNYYKKIMISELRIPKLVAKWITNIFLNSIWNMRLRCLPHHYLKSLAVQKTTKDRRAAAAIKTRMKRCGIEIPKIESVLS